MGDEEEEMQSRIMVGTADGLHEVGHARASALMRPWTEEIATKQAGEIALG